MDPVISIFHNYVYLHLNIENMYNIFIIYIYKRFNIMFLYWNINARFYNLVFAINNIGYFFQIIRVIQEIRKHRQLSVFQCQVNLFSTICTE